MPNKPVHLLQCVPLSNSPISEILPRDGAACWSQPPILRLFSAPSRMYCQVDTQRITVPNAIVRGQFLVNVPLTLLLWGVPALTFVLTRAVLPTASAFVAGFIAAW